MDLAKIIANEIKEDNNFLRSKDVNNFEIVDKITIGEVKSIDFRNLDTGAITTVLVQGRGVISYNSREIDLPNMMLICEQVLGVSL